MWYSPRNATVTKAIDVSLPRCGGANRRHRVEASVDGRRIWFESGDVPLEAAAEAFGAALLVPSLHAGRPLRLAGPVCATWSANLARLTDEFHTLWYPAGPRPLVVPATRAADDATAAGGTALCFSGGVDAFYTLLCGGHPIGRLVYGVGYDVSLRKRRRAADVTTLIRDVASETGCESTVIHTNLRRHPLVKRAPWLRAFGGSLAAIGHLLGPGTGRMLLSSDGLGFEHPEVGSRPSTDPLHGSATLAVEHVAPAVTRLEKIRTIAREPLVQRHLRVCWKNVGSLMNCGRCEKCIRTMLAIDACGMLGLFPGFASGRGLGSAIDALPAVDAVVEPFYRDLLGRGLSPMTAAAVGRLLERTAPRSARASVALSPQPAFRHRLLGPAAFSSVCTPLVGQRVGYVRPEGNVGDHLIEVAMIQLFAEYGVRWRRWRPEVPADADGLDLLVFGGGGNMGTRYAGNHDLRSRALASGLPVVILPQSFTSVEDRPYARVFVRERGSLAFRPDGILAPDLALGIATAEPAPPRHDVGIFLRRDQERLGRKPFFVRDPIRLRRDPLEYLALAARYRRIVTDRLHFAIAGLHAGRDVTLVANDYHKNRSMHETWLSDLGCRFAATIAEAYGRRAA
jgi:hypothetical protein